jgi:hypothetical protein
MGNVNLHDHRNFREYKTSKLSLCTYLRVGNTFGIDIKILGGGIAAARILRGLYIKPAQKLTDLATGWTLDEEYLRISISSAINFIDK